MKRIVDGFEMDMTRAEILAWHARQGPGWADVSAAQAALSEMATARRWQVETGGVDVADGVRVGTTIEDQNRITSVIANMQAAGIASVDFKAASGWVTLTADDLRNVAAAIALHVQDAFTAERAMHEQIEALASIEAAEAFGAAHGFITERPPLPELPPADFVPVDPRPWMQPPPDPDDEAEAPTPQTTT